MSLNPVTTSAAAAPAGPYSQAIAANGFVFASGQRPVHPETGKIEEDFSAQVHQVLQNLAAVLKSAGSDLSKVVRVNIYLSDIGAFDEMNKIYTTYFREPYPARTTVACTLRGIMVEIDAVAVA
ncbi:MAG TPA: Rid family detoxifying hydrolase [Micromonosporaceae bacterium]|nr:Rid family detoxifying hydrolase [Micromonosporaceae bacterium]